MITKPALNEEKKRVKTKIKKKTYFKQRETNSKTKNDKSNYIESQKQSGTKR